MHNENHLNVEFLNSIYESKERLRRVYQEITGESELEKGLVQIIRSILDHDEVA